MESAGNGLEGRARDASLGARVGRFVIRRYRTCFAMVLAVMACNVFLRASTTPTRHVSPDS